MAGLTIPKLPRCGNAFGRSIPNQKVGERELGRWRLTYNPAEPPPPHTSNLISLWALFLEAWSLGLDLGSPVEKRNKGSANTVGGSEDWRVGSQAPEGSVTDNVHTPERFDRPPSAQCVSSNTPRSVLCGIRLGNGTL